MELREKIGTRITQARKAQGMSIKELSEKLNNELSAARISNWEQGTRSPGPYEVKLLAPLLNVSASYLLCLTDSPEGELNLNHKRRTRLIPVLTMAEASHARELMQSQTSAQPLLFDQRERAIMVDEFNKADTNDCLFAVVVEDGSMQPQINVGDIIIANRDLPPKPGDLVLVHIKAKKQTVLRRYGEAENCLFQLLASNELWATINVKHADEVELCGTIVEFRRYL